MVKCILFDTPTAIAPNPSSVTSIPISDWGFFLASPTQPMFLTEKCLICQRSESRKVLYTITGNCVNNHALTLHNLYT